MPGWVTVFGQVNYVISYRGQLSLAIPPWVGTVSTNLGWEGNCRSGIALAMRQSQTVVVYPPTGSPANEKEMSVEYGPSLPLPLNCICRSYNVV